MGVKSFACQAEYFSLSYSSLKPVGKPSRDADLYSYYASILYFPTGEEPAFEKGIMVRVSPRKPLICQRKTMVALGIALRYDHFQGDKAWINPVSNVSVREADSFSLGINWILLPMCRVLLDYTYTDLSDPIRVRVLPDGSINILKQKMLLHFVAASIFDSSKK